VTPGGAPHLVPIVFAVVGDTVYSAVDAKPKRTTALARLRNIAAHPAAAVLVDHYDEDWTSLWWARADGVARVLTPPEDAAEIASALALLSAKYPQQTGAGTVLAVDVERFSGWTAAGG
jgi:PPOX class probable F420-dependent enzyme